MDNDQIGVLGARSGETSERDLSWFDWSLTADVSRDGRNLVFFESGEGVGANYSTFIRGMDGSPAVRLGSGTYPSLSPDGKWVAVVNNASPSQLEILPTGTGQPRQITHDSLEHLSVGWAPNGRAIVFCASEPNHAVRTYWMNLDDGKTRAITPEGTEGTRVSPDGKYLLATDPEEKRWLYPLERADPQPLSAAVNDDEFLIDWEADGKSILVGSRGIPCKVTRVYLNSTHREDVRTLFPSDAGGIVSVTAVRLSADRKTYAYSYYRILSDLYVVDGLR